MKIIFLNKNELTTKAHLLAGSTLYSYIKDIGSDKTCYVLSREGGWYCANGPLVEVPLNALPLGCKEVDLEGKAEYAGDFIFISKMPAEGYLVGAMQL